MVRVLQTDNDSQSKCPNLLPFVIPDVQKIAVLSNVPPGLLSSVDVDLPLPRVSILCVLFYFQIFYQLRVHTNDSYNALYMYVSLIITVRVDINTTEQCLRQMIANTLSCHAMP